MGAKTCTARTFSRAGLHGIGHVEFVSAPGSGDVVGVGDLFSVEPDVGAVVDALEIQPDGFSGVGCGRGELLAIPPGDGVGTIRLHGDVGEISADGIGDAGELAEVHGEERVGEGFVFDQRRDDRGGHSGVVPSLGERMRRWK